MKKILYLSAALLAAAACSREPVVTEEPGAGPESPIRVSLVAGNPATRTELGYDNGVLKPFWSAGDDIKVFPADPTDESDMTVFSGNLGSAAVLAQFDGSVPAAGSYMACYPAEGPELCLYEGEVALAFTIPSVQHPTLTSFDPAADLLISVPFEVTAAGANSVGPESAGVIPVQFTRANAIVKIVLKDKTNGGQGGKLTGHKVQKVILGYAPDDAGFSYAPAHTRADYFDEDGDETGLSGDMYYLFEAGAFNYYDTDYWVAAEYAEGQEYAIGDEGAATYLITTPCVLQNDSYGEGLFIQIETDQEIIYRDVTLPEAGLALQPSRMTTLNISLYDDGVNETTYEPKGVFFTATVYNEEEGYFDEVKVESLELEVGEEVYLSVYMVGVPVPDELSEIVLEPADSPVFRFSLDEASYSDGYLGSLILYGMNVGQDVFTVRLPGGQSASLSITTVLGDGSRSLDGNYGEDNKPGGGINDDNYVDGGEY